MPFSGNNSFWKSATLDFVCILSVNKGFTVFQNILLSVVARILVLLKKFFFSRLIELTQRLCCLLYTFLSISLFVLKDLFLSSYLFMIFLIIVLSMEGAWFSRTYAVLLEHLWIASLSAALKKWNWRSLFSEVAWNILYWTSAINTSLKNVYSYGIFWLFDLLDIIWLIQESFSGILKQVLSVITFLQP